MYQVRKVDVYFYKFKRGYHSIGIRTVFYGAIQIKLKLANGDICSTILPVNLHGQTVFSGKDERDLLEHYCVPLKWKLFDVKECEFWSGWDENSQRTVYLHFDNSIKILFQKDYTTYLMFKKPFDKVVEKWNGYEYVEFCEFETLRRLFHYRFVENKRRVSLFRELDLTYKKLSS